MSTVGPMQMRLSGPVVVLASTIALVVAGCSEDAPSATSSVVASPPVVTSAVVTSPVVPATLVPGTALPATTEAPTATEAPTTTRAPVTAAPTTSSVDDLLETREIGRSVEGRAIVAQRRGTAGGRVVLVIGVIHGDENDGMAIMQRLQRLHVPTGVDLWLVDSMNPDGLFHDVRHNANQVDLNRNFPENWGPIGVPGDGQYAGPSAASEPETQAMVDFMTDIRPDLVLWYHQDLYRIAPGRGRDGLIRQRYAELTGLPVVSITGGTYTGVAATWARNLLAPGVAFIVELGSSVSDGEADLHAAAVMTVAAEDI